MTQYCSWQNNSVLKNWFLVVDGSKYLSSSLLVWSVVTMQVCNMVSEAYKHIFLFDFFSSPSSNDRQDYGRMMEESGIETTPPSTPPPPLSAAVAISPPPLTIGKTWAEPLSHQIKSYFKLSFLIASVLFFFFSHDDGTFIFNQGFCVYAAAGTSAGCSLITYKGSKFDCRGRMTFRKLFLMPVMSIRARFNKLFVLFPGTIKTHSVWKKKKDLHAMYKSGLQA